jgi:hypothetical protein
MLSCKVSRGHLGVIIRLNRPLPHPLCFRFLISWCNAASEHLELAYTRDLVKPSEYTAACTKLLGQFKLQEQTLLGMGAITSVQDFLREYGCDARLRWVGVLLVSAPPLCFARAAASRCHAP